MEAPEKMLSLDYVFVLASFTLFNLAPLDK